MPHGFDENLRLLAPGNHPRYGRLVRPGPLATGPVADGERMSWIQVWVFQNTDGNAAAATGTRDWSERAVTRTWTTPTELAQGSEDFLPGKPAQATALALVKRGRTTEEFYWWSVPVMIDPGNW
jgi:hypothetical protein